MLAMGPLALSLLAARRVVLDSEIAGTQPRPSVPEVRNVGAKRKIPDAASLHRCRCWLLLGLRFRRASSMLPISCTTRLVSCALRLGRCTQALKSGLAALPQRPLGPKLGSSLGPDGGYSTVLGVPEGGDGRGLCVVLGPDGEWVGKHQAIAAPPGRTGARR